MVWTRGNDQVTVLGESMITIRANEELFKKWKFLGMQIGLLSSIVQNDIDISEEQLQQFVQEYNDLRKEMQDIMALTFIHIHS